ncbi:MAG TPA: F0F1 ATP synthase subunit A [Gemmatimonadaceae bacterium]|nr:F0F1 ATP synthase subunit A [Gemmatimonadaceae bacterium]
MRFTKSLLLAALVAVPSTVVAQEHGAPPAAGPAAESHATQAPAAGLDTIPVAAEKKGNADYIMPHLTDSKHLELPCFKNWKEWACGITIPTYTVHLGSTEFDLLPTKHGVFLILTALVTCLVLVTTARRHARDTDAFGRPKGRAAGLEGVLLYMRNEVYMKALGGHGGEKYVPFVLTLFFFIMIANMFGLVPWGSSATGNLAVTGTLALITLVMVEAAGMKALGAGYMSTIIYWPHDMPLAMKLPLTLILSPIELLGKLTKPFALTVRLFANMVAGHVILLAFMGMMFTSLAIGIPALGFAFLMMFMELGVAILQAFIFSVLAAVFIGQIRAAHH